MWDLAVVGAGPAGSAAALSALRCRPDAKVLLLDRAAFPRDKCCGDGIAAHAVDELARLGVAQVLADRMPIPTMRLRAPSGLEVSRRIARPTYVVPREVFDARLVAAAVSRGAVLWQRNVRRLDIRPDRVVLDDEIEARVVVGADGANGVVRRAMGVPRQPDAAVAVAVRGYVRSHELEQVVVMDRGAWPAYAWRFDAGDGTANVGFGMLLPALRNAEGGGRRELLARLDALLPGLDPTRLVSHKLPLSTDRPQQPRGRVLLAGDAASLVNPLTGEGIFYALLSGRLAGQAAESATDPGAAYAGALRRELGRHLRHTTILNRFTSRVRVVEAGVAACKRDGAAFDALVELGLGRGLITAPLVTGAARALGRRVAAGVSPR